MYRAMIWDWYKPIMTAARIEETRRDEIMDGCIGLPASWAGWKPNPPRRKMMGAHTYFIILGFDELAREFYQELMSAIKLPEAAVIVVKDEQVCRRGWHSQLRVRILHAIKNSM